MDLKLIGSWHLEGVSTLRDRPDPEASDEVWKPNRAAPQHRLAFRVVSRRDPPLRPPESYTWRVEVEDGRQYLVLTRPAGQIGPLRLWKSRDGQKMLWAMSPAIPDPPTATLFVRDKTVPVGRRAKRGRTRRSQPPRY